MPEQINGWQVRHFTAHQRRLLAANISRFDLSGLRTAEGLFLLTLVEDRDAVGVTSWTTFYANQILKAHSQNQLPLAITPRGEMSRDFFSNHSLLPVAELPSPDELAALGEASRVTSLEPHRYTSRWNESTVRGIGYFSIDHETGLERYGCLLPETGELFQLEMETVSLDRYEASVITGQAS